MSGTSAQQWPFISEAESTPGTRSTSATRSIIAFIGSREVCAISPGSRNGILAKPMAGRTPSLRICISILAAFCPVSKVSSCGAVL